MEEGRGRRRKKWYCAVVGVHRDAVGRVMVGSEYQYVWVDVGVVRCMRAGEGGGK